MTITLNTVLSLPILKTLIVLITQQLISLHNHNSAYSSSGVNCNQPASQPRSHLKTHWTEVVNHGRRWLRDGSSGTALTTSMLLYTSTETREGPRRILREQPHTPCAHTHTPHTHNPDTFRILALVTLTWTIIRYHTGQSSVRTLLVFWTTT